MPSKSIVIPKAKSENQNPKLEIRSKYIEQNSVATLRVCLVIKRLINMTHQYTHAHTDIHTAHPTALGVMATSQLQIQLREGQNVRGIQKEVESRESAERPIGNLEMSADFWWLRGRLATFFGLPYY